MSRKFLQIQQINTESSGWTALIQVVERTKVLTGRPPKNTKYRRYLFTDAEGTKVTALVYGNDIPTLEEKKKLLLYKRYYVSNAEVKEADPKYLVGDYPFSWTLSKRHLIEEVKEPLPPQFSCHIDIQKYKNLSRFAETENLQNVLGIVLHVFPVKDTQGSKTRDLVIVNEEKIPMILTLWGEFESDEGAQLAASVANGNIILAMRVRVTTFNYLSLSTKLPSAILINPPMREAATLKQWYVDQKNVLNSLVTKEAFKDPLVVLPPPNEKDIISIQEALATIKVNKSAWIRGVASLATGQKSLWFTACSNCQKEIGAPINWDINCTLCGEDSKVVARCRFVINIKDETGVLEAMITGTEAEQLLPFTGEEMSIAEAKNRRLLPEIVAGFYKNPITCFVRHYETTYSNMNADKYSVVKIYTEKEIGKITVSRTPVKVKEKINFMDEHSFTPTAKLMLESIDLSTPKPTIETTTKVVSTSTKRPLIFAAQEEGQVCLSQTMQSDMSIVSNEESTRAKIVDKDATKPTEQHHCSPAKKMKDQD